MSTDLFLFELVINISVLESHKKKLNKYLIGDCMHNINNDVIYLLAKSHSDWIFFQLNNKKKILVRRNKHTLFELFINYIEFYAYANQISYNMHNKNYSDVIYPFLQNNYSNLAKFCTTLTNYILKSTSTSASES